MKHVVIRGISLAEVRIFQQGESLVIDLSYKTRLARLWRALLGASEHDREFVRVNLEDGTYSARDLRYPS